MKAFKAPDETIGSTDAGTTATLITTAADFAIVVDADGIIHDMAFQQNDLSMELANAGAWYGRPWSETVSPQSQAKVATLIREAETNSASRWRQVSHPSTRGRDIPVMYAAVRLGNSDRFVALARDLRAVSALQQRLVDAQMTLERDYAQLRFAETRYRLLFQTASEPVLVLEAGTQKVVELNPAAKTLLDAGTRKIIGRPLAELLDPGCRATVHSTLAGLGPAAEIKAKLVNGRDVVFAATLMRQESGPLTLLRILQPGSNAKLSSEDLAGLADFARAAPDAFVICDEDGSVLSANAAFAQMVQAGGIEDVRGRSLDQWLGRSGVDLNVIMANLRQHGSVRLFSTTLVGEGADAIDVEVSAVLLPGEQSSFGFAIRDVGRRLSRPAEAAPSQELPHSASQLTELIGRVPLRDLVRETTDVIEKLCIEKALELTGDNRALAAEMLGLSRQSLYVKLRRFDMDDPSDEADPESTS